MNNPLLLIVDAATVQYNGVVFKKYVWDETDEAVGDRYFGDVLRHRIVGLEQKDGSVVVYKNGVKLKRPLRNKKIFMEKYFSEAL